MLLIAARIVKQYLVVCLGFLKFFLFLKVYLPELGQGEDGERRPDEADVAIQLQPPTRWPEAGLCRIKNRAALPRLRGYAVNVFDAPNQGLKFASSSGAGLKTVAIWAVGLKHRSGARSSSRAG